MPKQQSPSRRPKAKRQSARGVIPTAEAAEERAVRGNPGNGGSGGRRGRNQRKIVMEQRATPHRGSPPSYTAPPCGHEHGIPCWSDPCADCFPQRLAIERTIAISLWREHGSRIARPVGAGSICAITLALDTWADYDALLGLLEETAPPVTLVLGALARSPITWRAWLRVTLIADGQSMSDLQDVVQYVPSADGVDPVEIRFADVGSAVDYVCAERKSYHTQIQLWLRDAILSDAAQWLIGGMGRRVVTPLGPQALPWPGQDDVLDQIGGELAQESLWEQEAEAEWYEPEVRGPDY